jgi:arabinose-5-phosphate isomerase
MHTDNIPIVHRDQTLGRALQVLDQGGLGTVIVVNQKKRLEGILTDGDVRRMICRMKYDLEQPIHNYMTVNPQYVIIGQKGGQVLDQMEKGAIMVLPVVDREQILHGVVHMHDLLGKGRLSFNGLTKSQDR